MEDLVSVIVPIYKVEKYLKNCVNSILKQTYKHLEIILIDDGSPDNCGKICDDYAKKYKQIKVVHKDNGGLSDARNAGINVASGTFITCIDGDDYISNDYVEYLVKILDDNAADISICGLKKTINMYEDVTLSVSNYEVKVMTAKEAIKEMLYAENFSTSVCGRLFKKTLFDEVIFPLNKYSEDMFTMYKLFLKSTKIVFSSKIAYFYFYRPESISTGRFQKKHLDVIEALHQIKKEVIDTDDRLLAAYRNQVVEVTSVIMSKQPPKEYIIDNGLWNEARAYAPSVAFDKNACKRVRAQAFLMLLGRKISSFIVRKYYICKWK